MPSDYAHLCDMRPLGAFLDLELDALVADEAVEVDRGIEAAACRHDRKGGGEVGDSGRGSSQASGDVDVILAVRRPEGNQPSNRRVIEALSRYRDTPDKVVVELGPDGYALLGTDEAVATADAEKFVSSLGWEIETNYPEGLPRPVIVQRASAEGHSAKAIDEALARLLVKGWERLGEGKRGDPHRYRPVARGTFYRRLGALLDKSHSICLAIHGRRYTPMWNLLSWARI